MKKYKLRRTGAYGRSIETTIPQDAFDREVRRLGLSRDEAMDLLQAVWRYGDFHGIYLAFEEIERTEEKDGEN